jgi:hypothetical protein
MRAWLFAVVCAAALPNEAVFACGPGETTGGRACSDSVRVVEERPRSERRARTVRRPAVQAAPPAAMQVCPAEAPQASARRYLPHYFL